MLPTEWQTHENEVDQSGPTFYSRSPLLPVENMIYSTAQK